MKEKEVRIGAMETMVKIVDWTPINRIVSEKAGFPVECRIGNGIIMNVKAVFDENYDVEEERHILIDSECCGVSSQKKYQFSSDLNEGSPFSVKWFEGIGFFKVNTEKEEGKMFISMFPSFYMDIDSDDVIKCLTGEEKSLFEYMGSRYAYNPRISNNELDILKLVYHHHIVNGLKDWSTKIKKQIVA